MEISRIVIFGHSHVWAMRRAAAMMASRKGVPQIDVPLCGNQELPGPIVTPAAGGGLQLVDKIAALVQEAGQNDQAATTLLMSMVRGNYYNQLGMLATGGAFDLVLPFRPDLALQPGAVVIPYGALRAKLWGMMADGRDFAKLMAQTGFAGRTLIAGPPPPPRDEAPILDLLKSMNLTDPPSAALVRLKLWHLQNHLHAQICKDLSLTYLPGTPEGTQDDEGFLRPEFVKDAVHANGDWAVRYLETAFALIKEKVDV